MILCLKITALLNKYDNFEVGAANVVKTEFIFFQYVTFRSSLLKRVKIVHKFLNMNKASS